MEQKGLFWMNHWNTRFHTDEFVYGKEPNIFISELHKKLHIAGHALAIAEGEGRNAVYLAEQGMNVTSWDYAESGLEKTNMLAEERGVAISTEPVDLNNANWTKDKWDEIVCVFGHFPTELRRRTLQGVKEAVKPGGYYLTEVYSHYQIPYKSGGPPDLDFLYRPEEFLDTFSEWHINHFSWERWFVMRDCSTMVYHMSSNLPGKNLKSEHTKTLAIAPFGGYKCF